MQYPSRECSISTYICRAEGWGEVLLQGFGGVLSPCFLLKITSQPFILLQGRPFTHRGYFSSSLLKLVCIHCCAAHHGNSHFPGRCSVKWCCGVFPAVSLGTDDGHSSFGPSAACSRAALDSSALLCLHGSTPRAGERGCTCPGMSTVMWDRHPVSVSCTSGMRFGSSELTVKMGKQNCS